MAAAASPCPLTNRHPISERRWFVALGDVVVVEAAFGCDASLTVVFAGVLAARHHQATASVDAWRIRRCADGRGGLAQGWKQQPATGMGRVDLPTEDCAGGITTTIREDHHVHQRLRSLRLPLDAYGLRGGRH